MRLFLAALLLAPAAANAPTQCWNPPSRPVGSTVAPRPRRNWP